MSNLAPKFEVIEEKVLVDVGDVIELPEGATIITVAKELYHHTPIEVLVSVPVTELTKNDGPFVKVNKTAEAVKRDAAAKVEVEKAAKKQQKAIEEQVAAEEAAKAAADPDYVKPTKPEPKVEPKYSLGEKLGGPKPDHSLPTPNPPGVNPPKVNPLEKEKR